MKYFLLLRNARILLFALLIAVLLPSCEWFDDEDDDPTPALTVSFLAGDWIRTGGNNSNGQGMEISVSGDQGVITDPAGASFRKGDIKWSNITVSDEESFDHEELGSDGNYYEATIKIISENEIEISVASAGAGNFQEWTRL